jgi:single-strand DNA-binding protein
MDRRKPVSNNLVVLTGNLGADVEVRYTGTGKAVANIRVAVSSGSGEKKKTDWFSCVLWEGLAEQAQQNLGKGSEVTVIGRLQNRKWEKDGKDVWVTEVVATALAYGQPRAEKAQAAPIEEDSEESPF